MIRDSSPDQLDVEIAAAKMAVADAERKLDMDRVMLATLERAASLRPRLANDANPTPLGKVFAPFSLSQPTTKSRGKSPGAISGKWRSIMQEVVAGGNHPLMPDAWAHMANQKGYSLDTKTARDWLRRAVVSEFGFIVRDGDAFRVSDAAIERFNLKTAGPPPEVSSDGPT